MFDEFIKLSFVSPYGAKVVTNNFWLLAEIATDIVKFIPSRDIALIGVSTLLLKPNIAEFAIFKRFVTIKASLLIIS